MFTRPIGIPATPIISPSSGEILYSQQISISSTGSPVRIEYSTDGINWITYTNPFTLSTSATVYARAVSSSGLYSEIGSETYVVLPYDSKIEYLQSTGLEYIDSGIECTGDLSVELSIKVFAYSTGNPYMGGIATTPEGYFCHYLYFYNTSGSNFYPSFYYYKNGSNSGKGNIQGYGRSSSLPNKWMTFSLDASTGNVLWNNRSSTVTPLSSTLTTGKNYGIFGRIADDGTVAMRDSALEYVKLSKNGVVLRDFIPVRKGTTGYMYDKVSGQLFGNSGTGDFILGNDITD